MVIKLSLQLKVILGYFRFILLMCRRFQAIYFERGEGSFVRKGNPHKNASMMGVSGPSREDISKRGTIYEIL